MNITEKSAYLKGLVEGSELKLGDKEKKVFDALLDLVDEMAKVLKDCDDDLTELYDEVADLEEEVEDIDDVLDEMLDEDYEDYDFDDFDDEDDFDDFDEEEHHHHHHHHHGCGCGCEDEDEDDFFYDVTCPSCNKTFTVEEDTILSGNSVKCPFCGEDIEFDLSGCEDCEDEDCDCCGKKD